MRQLLKSSRISARFTQKYVAERIGISLRMYAAIENGEREGKGHIWDALEALFGIPQRQLRENTTQENSNTEGRKREISHSVAAARLSHIPADVMVEASEDLQDGVADTPEGEMVLDLMKKTGGAALEGVAATAQEALV